MMIAPRTSQVPRLGCKQASANHSPSEGMVWLHATLPAAKAGVGAALRALPARVVVTWQARVLPVLLSAVVKLPKAPWVAALFAVIVPAGGFALSRLHKKKVPVVSPPESMDMATLIEEWGPTVSIALGWFLPLALYAAQRLFSRRTRLPTSLANRRRRLTPAAQTGKKRRYRLSRDDDHPLLATEQAKRMHDEQQAAQSTTSGQSTTSDDSPEASDSTSSRKKSSTSSPKTPPPGRKSRVRPRGAARASLRADFEAAAASQTPSDRLEAAHERALRRSGVSAPALQKSASSMSLDSSDVRVQPLFKRPSWEVEHVELWRASLRNTPGREVPRWR